MVSVVDWLNDHLESYVIDWLLLAEPFGQAMGTEEEIDTAFEQTYRIIRARSEAFLALPLAELTNYRARLNAELDKIGTILA